MLIWRHIGNETKVIRWKIFKEIMKTLIQTNEKNVTKKLDELYENINIC